MIIHLFISALATRATRLSALSIKSCAFNDPLDVSRDAAQIARLSSISLTMIRSQALTGTKITGSLTRKRSFVIHNSNVKVSDCDFRALGSWSVCGESASDQQYTTRQTATSGTVSYERCTFIDIEGVWSTAGTNNFQGLARLTVSQCTFQNCANQGTIWMWYGSAMFCSFNAPIILTDTVFKDFVHLYSTTVCHLQGPGDNNGQATTFSTAPVIIGCTFEHIKTLSKQDKSLPDDWKQEAGGSGLAIRFADEVTLTNCIFNDTCSGVSDSAGDNGGALFLNNLRSPDASYAIEECTFIRNKAWNEGACLHLAQACGSIEITDCYFESPSLKQTTSEGLAVSLRFSFTSLSIKGCTFENIDVTVSNAIVVATAMVPLTLENCMFRDIQYAVNSAYILSVADSITSAHFTNVSFIRCAPAEGTSLTSFGCVWTGTGLTLTQCRLESCDGFGINARTATLTVNACIVKDGILSSSTPMYQIWARSRNTAISDTNFSNCATTCIKGDNVPEFTLSNCHFNADATIMDSQASIAITGTACDADIISCSFQSETKRKLEISFAPTSGTISFTRDCCFSSSREDALSIGSEAINVVPESEAIFGCVFKTMTFSASDQLTESQHFTFSRSFAATERFSQTKSFTETERFTSTDDFSVSETLIPVSRTSMDLVKTTETSEHATGTGASSNAGKSVIVSSHAQKDSQSRSDLSHSSSSSSIAATASSQVVVHETSARNEQSISENAQSEAKSIMAATAPTTTTDNGQGQKGDGGLSSGQIAGIVVGVIVAITIVVIVVVVVVKKKQAADDIPQEQAGELSEEGTIESLTDTMTDLDSFSSPDKQLWILDGDPSPHADPADKDDSDARQFNNELFDEGDWD